MKEAAAALGGKLQASQLAQTTTGAGTPDPQMFATLDPRAALETLSTFEKMMLLRQVPLFANLDPDDLEELSALAIERRYTRDAALCKEGEQSDEVFLVVSGRVRAWVTGAGGAERTLGESGDGSCIGEMAALDHAPRTATVSAMTDTRVLVLAGSEFKSLLSQRPAIAGGVIGVLTRRLRDMIAQKGAS
jgi:CRP-like cAMP-binding protein